MTVFKYFLKLSARQRGVIFLYLGIFLVIALLSSSQMPQDQAGFYAARPKIKILQEEASPRADGLAAFLRTQGEEVSLPITEASAPEALFSGAVDSLIVIPSDFSQALDRGGKAVRVYTDDRQMTAVLLKNTLSKYLLFLKADAAAYGQSDPARVGRALETEATVTLKSPTGTAGQEIARNWFRFYFNFISYIMVSIFIMIFGLIMSEFNTDSIKGRNSLIPVSSTRFQLQIVLAQLFVSFGITALFLFIGFVMKGGTAPGLNWLGHSLNAFAFALAALALSFLINAITRKPVIHTSLATVLSLGMSFISGVMVPTEFLSPAVVTLSKFFPAYYYVQATTRILEGAPYLSNLGILFLFALLFLVLGLTITRIKQGEDLLPSVKKPGTATAVGTAR